MSQLNLMSLLQAPIISEKSANLSDLVGQYVFKVPRQSTKSQIKKAVELMFEVEVDKVRVLNVKGKSKRFGRFLGKRPDWKKAYVKLKSGHEIELSTA